MIYTSGTHLPCFKTPLITGQPAEFLLELEQTCAIPGGYTLADGVAGAVR